MTESPGALAVRTVRLLTRTEQCAASLYKLWLEIALKGPPHRKGRSKRTNRKRAIASIDVYGAELYAHRVEYHSEMAEYLDTIQARPKNVNNLAKVFEHGSAAVPFIVTTFSFLHSIVADAIACVNASERRMAIDSSIAASRLRAEAMALKDEAAAILALIVDPEDEPR